MHLHKFIPITVTLIIFVTASNGRTISPDAKIIFNKLQPELLGLFPESQLIKTEVVPSIDFGENVTITEVSYVLSNGTTSVTEEIQEKCIERLRDPFLTWMKYSGTLNTENLDGFFSNKRFDSHLISSGNSVLVAFSNDQKKRCFQLEIEFIERQEMLIISCQLALNLPPPPESELEIVNPAIRYINDAEGKREYEVTFGLMNQSATALNVVTDSFYTSAPQRHLSIAEIQVRLLSRSLIDGQNPTIQTLQPGKKISIRDTFYPGTSVLESFVVTYETEMIDSLKSDYWQGKVTSRINEMEPEHGAYGANAAE